MAIIIIRTLIVYLALLFAMRMMGKRQLGEMELSELVVAVLIADMAAHPLQDIGIPIMNGLIPIIVLFCCEILVAGISTKSIKFRRALFGLPSFIIIRGRINQKEMHKNRLTLDELTAELRQNSVTDISKVQYAILETSGMLSVIVNPEEKPPTAKNMDIPTEDAGYSTMVICDGRVLGDNLKFCGRDEKWLHSELSRRGVPGVRDVYLMTVDGMGNVYFAPKEHVR